MCVVAVECRLFLYRAECGPTAVPTLGLSSDILIYTPDRSPRSPHPSKPPTHQHLHPSQDQTAFEVGVAEDSPGGSAVTLLVFLFRGT